MVDEIDESLLARFTWLKLFSSSYSAAGSVDDGTGRTSKSRAGVDMDGIVDESRSATIDLLCIGFIYLIGGADGERACHRGEEKEVGSWRVCVINNTAQSFFTSFTRGNLL